MLQPQYTQALLLGRGRGVLAGSARGPQSKGGFRIAPSLRPAALSTLVSGGAPRRIGLSYSLLGAALAREQDAERQKRNARIKPQRGMANIPVVEAAGRFRLLDAVTAAGGLVACLETSFKSNGGIDPSIRHFQVEPALRLVGSGSC
jgi:hypothetical protein